MWTDRATHKNTASDSLTEKFLSNFWKNRHRQACTERNTTILSASLMLFSQCSAPKLQDVDISAESNIMLDFPVSKGRFFSRKILSVFHPIETTLLSLQLWWLICGRSFFKSAAFSLFSSSAGWFTNECWMKWKYLSTQTSWDFCKRSDCGRNNQWFYATNGKTKEMLKC